MGGWFVTSSTGLGVLASIFWIAQLVEAIRYRMRAVWLADLPDQPPPPDGGWPAVAVIFAARNEAPMVERAARSMLGQDYPALGVIAVDDRSTDATGTILDSLAGEDARLSTVHVRALPVGWLGKTHALHVAAETTGADWLLFSDADVVFAPATIRKAIALAEGRGVDHLALVPDILTRSTAERAFVMMFILMFNAYAPPRRVTDPRSKVSAGVGAFNLVRADAFRAIGGFRRLAMSVDEDMRLGQALKFAGYRSLLAMGMGAVSVRWQVGLAGMIGGLEKNFFAGAGYRLSVVAIAATGLAVIGFAPYAGLFVGPGWARAVDAAGIGAVALTLALMRRPGGVAWYHAFLLPVGASACIVALLRSALLALRRRGVRWRDHLYPLDELRDHARRRDEWAREVWRSTR